MLRTVFSVFISLSLCTAAYSQNCTSATPRPSFNFKNEEAEFHHAIYEIDAGWGGKWKDLTGSERLKNQEATIAKLTANYVKKHNTLHYSNHCVNRFSNICTLAQESSLSCVNVRTIDSARQHVPMNLQNRSMNDLQNRSMNEHFSE
jgi:hypothetical protein